MDVNEEKLNTRKVSEGFTQADTIICHSTASWVSLGYYKHRNTGKVLIEIQHL